MKRLYLRGFYDVLLNTAWFVIIGSLLFTNDKNAYGQCVDTIDFTRWYDVGPTGQSWEINSLNEVKETEESIPPVLNMFISNDVFIDVKIAFDFQSLNSADQDFIGFIAGFESPMGSGTDTHQFILFDWKAKKEEAFGKYAEEGFTLSEYHGNIPDEEIPNYFWGHNGHVQNSLYTLIAYRYGDQLGWKHLKKHHIEVTYTYSEIEVEVDGSIVLYIERCNQPGRIGLYTYSQHNVIFSNLTIQQAASAFVSPVNICAGDSVFFRMEESECGGFNPSLQHWVWDFGDGSFEEDNFSGYHSYQSPGVYSFQYLATFTGDCTDTITYQVAVQEPISVDLGPDTTLYTHSDLTLTAGPDLNDWEYEWPDGSVFNQVTLTDLEHDTSLWVNVTNNLCSAYDEINIHIIEPPTTNVFVPNAFSPDGDGYNDSFFPVFKNIEPGNYLLFIYNRWGQEIFQSTDPALGWDGMLNQTPCPSDIYIYLIRYTYHDPNLPEVNDFRKGTVMLVR